MMYFCFIRRGIFLLLVLLSLLPQQQSLTADVLTFDDASLECVKQGGTLADFSELEAAEDLVAGSSYWAGDVAAENCALLVIADNGVDTIESSDDCDKVHRFACQISAESLALPVPYKASAITAVTHSISSNTMSIWLQFKVDNPVAGNYENIIVTLRTKEQPFWSDGILQWVFSFDEASLDPISGELHYVLFFSTDDFSYWQDIVMELWVQTMDNAVDQNLSAASNLVAVRLVDEETCEDFEGAFGLPLVYTDGASTLSIQVPVDFTYSPEINGVYESMESVEVMLGGEAEECGVCEVIGDDPRYFLLCEDEFGGKPDFLLKKARTFDISAICGRDIRVMRFDLDLAVNDGTACQFEEVIEEQYVAYKTDILYQALFTSTNALEWNNVDDLDDVVNKETIEIGVTARYPRYISDTSDLVNIIATPILEVSVDSTFRLDVETGCPSGECAPGDAHESTIKLTTKMLYPYVITAGTLELVTYETNEDRKLIERTPGNPEDTDEFGLPNPATSGDTFFSVEVSSEPIGCSETGDACEQILTISSTTDDFQFEGSCGNELEQYNLYLAISCLETSGFSCDQAFLGEAISFYSSVNFCPLSEVEIDSTEHVDASLQAYWQLQEDGNGIPYTVEADISSAYAYLGYMYLEMDIDHLDGADVQLVSLQIEMTESDRDDGAYRLKINDDDSDGTLGDIIGVDDDLPSYSEQTVPTLKILKEYGTDGAADPSSIIFVVQVNEINFPAYPMWSDSVDDDIVGATTYKLTCEVENNGFRRVLTAEADPGRLLSTATAEADRYVTVQPGGGEQGGGDNTGAADQTAGGGAAAGASSKSVDVLLVAVPVAVALVAVSIALVVCVKRKRQGTKTLESNVLENSSNNNDAATINMDLEASRDDEK